MVNCGWNYLSKTFCAYKQLQVQAEKLVRIFSQIWSLQFPQKLALVLFPCGSFSPCFDGGNTVTAAKSLWQVYPLRQIPSPFLLSRGKKTAEGVSLSLLFPGLHRSETRTSRILYPPYHSFILFLFISVCVRQQRRSQSLPSQSLQLIV